MMLLVLQKVLFTFIFFTVLIFGSFVFAKVLDDKSTEAEGPGRCAYCDADTARIDERDIETNPEALALLHAAQAADSGSPVVPKKKQPATGVQ